MGSHDEKLNMIIAAAESHQASSEHLYHAAYAIGDIAPSSLTDDLLDKGQRFIDQAIHLEPHNPRYLWTKGYLLQRRSNVLRKQAIDCFRQAVELEPERKKNHYQYIAAHRSTGSLDAAVAYYLDQTTSHPHSAMSYAYLAFAYYVAQQFEEAVAAANHGLSVDATIADLYYVRGEALLAIGQIEDAVKDLGDCLEFDPSFLDARFTLAAFYERQERIAEAIHEWQQIISACEAMGDVDDETLRGYRANLSRLGAMID